jgi:hypothetical protein
MIIVYVMTIVTTRLVRHHFAPHGVRHRYGQ